VLVIAPGERPILAVVVKADVHVAGLEELRDEVAVDETGASVTRTRIPT